MLKKLVVLLCALMLLLGSVCAEGTTIYPMPEMNMTLTAPDSYLVLTRAATDEEYAALGLDGASVRHYMIANDTYMIIMPADMSYEVDVSMAPNTIETFNDVNDLMLSSMVGMVGGELEKMGAVFDRGEYYLNGSDKYLRLYYHVPGEAYDTYAVQYYTVQNNQAINFRMFTYGAEADEAQLAELEALMRGVQF